MTDVKLRWLKYFAVVANELHFGFAAKKLFISGPALSAQIRQLEAALNTSLFVRTTRKVRLTPAGRELLAGIEPALQQIDAAIAVATRTDQQHGGTLSVGFVSSLANDVVPLAASRFHEQHPAVALRLIECSSDEQRRDVETGLLNLGIQWALESEPTDATLTYQMYGGSSLYVAMHKNHRLAGRDQVHLAELAHEDWVLNAHAEGTGYRATFEQRCRTAGFTPKVFGEATGIHIMLGLVAAGLVVCTVPAITRTTQASDVAFVRLADQRLGLVAVHQRAPLDQLEATFMQIVWTAMEQTLDELDL